MSLSMPASSFLLLLRTNFGRKEKVQDAEQTYAGFGEVRRLLNYYQDKRKIWRYEKKVGRKRLRVILQAIALAVFMPLFLKRIGFPSGAALFSQIQPAIILGGIVISKSIARRTVELPELEVKSLE